jgi:hypothetical protein
MPITSTTMKEQTEECTGAVQHRGILISTSRCLHSFSGQVTTEISFSVPRIGSPLSNGGREERFTFEH